MVCAGGKGAGNVVRTDNERDTETIDLTAPDPVDADDITIVLPSAEPDSTHARRRTLIFAGAAVVAVVAIVAVAVAATRRQSSQQTVSAGVTPTSATSDRANEGSSTPPSTSKSPTSRPANTGAFAIAPPASVVAPQTTVPANPSVAPPPAVQTPPIGRTPATVISSPSSVLQWSASPVRLTLATGATTSVTVTVRNPSDGVVTLPVPLSCGPKLDGSGVCPEIAQLIQPHTQAAVRYTVDATNVAPGSYKLTIENGLFSIPVTVTA
jgi:hypothetical protein